MKRRTSFALAITYAILLLCQNLAWSQTPKSQIQNQPQSVHAMTLAASYIGTHPYERVGYELADAGDVNGDGYNDFIIGNYHHDIDLLDYSLKDAGAVYLILGRASGFAQNVSLNLADAMFVSKYSGHTLGYGIGRKGDANGDGLNDVLMGASLSAYHPGFAYLVFGRTQANWGHNFIVQDFADASFAGESNGSLLGSRLDFIGDLNGDGCDEFAVGASWVGKVYLIKGKRSGWQRNMNVASAAHTIFIGDSPGEAEPGYCVTSLGDINGDGIPDFAIGVMSHEISNSYVPGKAFIFFGRREIDWGSNFDMNGADVIFTEESGYPWTGTARSVAPAGDVNGDGYTDLLVNAPQFPSKNTNDANYFRGKTYLILGRQTWNRNYNLSQSDASYIGWTNGDVSGFGINGNLDFNGDGYGDFLIGAIQTLTYGAGSLTIGPGKVYWIKGAASGWSNNISLSTISDVVNGEGWGNSFGWAVSSIGDFNQDGSADFAVSAPFYSSSDYTSIGKIYIYLGEKRHKLIKGFVRYWKDNKPMARVSVKKDGNPMATTYYSGNYVLPLDAGTSCVVSVSKSHSADLGDTTISFYDAALAARCAVGRGDLDPNPRMAADINGDGRIMMDDAAKIARYAVGLEGSATIRAGDWFFVPPGIPYSNIQSDFLDQNYAANIRGDVDGSWGSGLSKRSEKLSGVLDKTAKWENDTLKVVFSLNEPVSILSFDFWLEFNSWLLSYCGYEQDNSGDFFTVFDAVRGGSLKLGGFRIEDSPRKGNLVVLKFKSIQGKRRFSPLLLKKVQLDQEMITREAELAVEDGDRPDEFGLLRNYPNPFNNRTVVEYSVVQDGFVHLGVYDVRGRQIRVLESGIRLAGTYRLNWNGLNQMDESVSSGVYVVKLIQGKGSKSTKILLLK